MSSFVGTGSTAIFGLKIRHFPANVPNVLSTGTAELEFEDPSPQAPLGLII